MYTQNVNELENVPAFSTAAPAPHLSSRYKFVENTRFVADLETLGFKLVKFQGPARGLGLHLMEFEHAGLPKLDGINMHLYAKNAHDGSACFSLGISMLRLVCTNGLIATTHEQQFKIKHIGYALSHVRDAVERVASQFTGVAETVARLQNTQLSAERTAQFVFEASRLRDVRPYRGEDFLQIRRDADKNTDIWTIFNRIQESLIRGGYQTQKILESGQVVAGPKARELKSVGDVFKINQALWTMANAL